MMGLYINETRRYKWYNIYLEEGLRLIWSREDAITYHSYDGIFVIDPIGVFYEF